MTSECSSLHCYVTINPANASKQRISQSQLNTAKSYKAFEALGKDSLFDVWWSFNQGFINQRPIIIPGFPLNGNADSWVGDIFGFHILKTFLYTVLYVLKTMHNISITCFIYYTKVFYSHLIVVFVNFSCLFRWKIKIAPKICTVNCSIIASYCVFSNFLYLFIKVLFF